MDQIRKFGQQTSRILEFKPKGLEGQQFIYRLDHNQKVSHLKISLENLRKKNHMTRVYQGTQHSTKKWENLNFLLNGQNPLFESFPTSWWCNLSNDFNLILSKLLFQWKTNSVQVFCGQNHISSTFFRDKTLEIYPVHIKGKP